MEREEEEKAEEEERQRRERRRKASTFWQLFSGTVSYTHLLREVEQVDGILADLGVSSHHFDAVEMCIRDRWCGGNAVPAGGSSVRAVSALRVRDASTSCPDAGW